MVVVDMHCHAGQSWFEPVEVLLSHMDRSGVAHAVLHQFIGMYFNDYILDCARRHPDRLRAVVMVDLSDENAPDTLEELAGQGAAGVRFMATARVAGDDPLALWQRAEKLGLVISCVGMLKDFIDPAFAEGIAAVPKTPVLIEHLAGIGQTGKPPYDDFRQALKLAEYPNTYIKVGGLGEIAARPDPLGAQYEPPTPPPYIEMARDAFGADRMMWGSDSPVSSGREGYHNVLKGVAEYPGLDDEQRKWVLGGTALKLFDFGGETKADAT